MSMYADFRAQRRFLPGLSFSPDGTKIAYIDDALGQFNAVVHSLDDDAVCRLTAFSDQTVRRVVWAPSGQSLLLQADANGTENTQLYEAQADGSALTALTDQPSVRHGLAQGEAFSPDGTEFAYFANDGAQAGFDTHVRSLVSGATRRVYDRGGRTYPAFWSPDGTCLSAVRYQEGYDQTVFLLPADGGEPVRLTPETPSAVYAVGPWLPDGSAMIVRSDAGREFLGLAMLDARSGLLTWLDTPDWDVEDAALSGDGRALAWLVNVDGASQLRLRDMVTGADLAGPSLPLGRARSLVVSANGQRLALLMSTSTRAWDVLAVDLAAATTTWLTTEQPPALSRQRPVEPELVRFPSFDDRTISAYLYRPATASGPVGVLLSIHGGPVHQERPVYEPLYQYLLSQGVAVLAPNIRGSSGYGKSFQMLVYRDWGGGDLQDIAAAARFLKAQPWVRPDRIGLFGGSYGAFMVLSAVARLPEVGWAAAVDLFGPSNLITMAKATPPAFVPLVTQLIGHPDDDADDLIKRSPITYADAIRAPLFVLQGANDIRVTQAESDQLVDSLRARGVEVRYDVYPDEGHGFMKTSNEVKADEDVAQFLLNHLG